MTMILEDLIADIDFFGSGAPENILSRLRDAVIDALEYDAEEQALDAAASVVEFLLVRVIRFSDSLNQLEVPPQESERHQRLLDAFQLYNSCLSTLSDALVLDQNMYDSELVEGLKVADEVVTEHRAASSRRVEISTIM